MLKKTDTGRKMPKPEFKTKMARLEKELGVLQRDARALGIPVIFVFEGWDAAGKGTQINKLILALDPRGFTVHPTNPPTEEERLRPFLWRFWSRTPAKGRIAVFDRSWYGRVLVERVDGLVKNEVWQRAYREIESFESQLAADGAVIVKYFLHIGKATQKARFKKLLANPATAWKVTKEDWRHHRQYDKYLKAANDALRLTNRPQARWSAIDAEDERSATVKIFTAAAAALRKAVRARKAAAARPAPPAPPARARKSSILDRVDLSPRLELEAYGQEVKKCQERLWNLEHEIYTRRIPVIVLYEGWDAAGKGGTIRRLVSNLDPRGYEVIPIAAPNVVEKNQHYLWRFWTRIPKAGHIAIFDRTWYGRVLVERIEGFCPPSDWRRAYGEINEMEAQLASFGAVLVKFWLHIDKDEQLRRFNARQQNPAKQWKITEEDWRNREKFDIYKAALDDMLALTSTPQAPWTIVEANDKYYARIKTLKTVVTAIEKRLRK